VCGVRALAAAGAALAPLYLTVIPGLPDFFALVEAYRVFRLVAMRGSINKSEVGSCPTFVSEGASKI
jgi:predicted signal transduction protein with EAL and GGDEF domain